MQRCFRNRASNTIITPKGIKRPKRPFSSHLSSLREDVFKALYLIRFDLQREAFGTRLGHLWLFLEPALQAAAYFFLLKVVFGMKGADVTFASFYSAISFWRSHAVLVGGGPSLFVGKGKHYLQQSMSLRIAYIEFAAREYLLFLLRLLILCGFLIATGSAEINIFAAIIVSWVQFSLSMAIAIWLSLCGAVVKDVSKIVGHAVWFWWYLSPGLYSVARVPEWLMPIYAVNPFSYIIPAIHASLLNGGNDIHWWAMFSIMGASSVVLWVGWNVMTWSSYRLHRYA